MITRDKIHEVIQMSVGFIQNSNLIPGALMNTATMSKTPRKTTYPFMTVLPQYLLPKYNRLWMV